MKTIEEVTQLLGDMPSPDLPLALFPVQIQTRFVTRAGQVQLLVRMFPDDVHIDSHEEQLTAAEAEWGKRYWELIWEAARDQEQLQRAWDQLAGRFGAQRAAWAIRQMTPTNLAQRSSVPPVFPNPGPLKTDTWTLPAQARLLPDRWVVVGYAAGQRVVLEVGSPIPAQLAVSLAPDETPAPPVGDDTLSVDEGIRWMVDFDEAERVGMAVRIPLPPGPAAPRFNRLLVFGIKGGLSAAKSATLLEEQLDAHHFTSGLGILSTGTPTNNTAEASSGFSRRDPASRESFQVEIRPPGMGADTDGALLARLLGVRQTTFRTIQGADQEENHTARAMLTALWPVTGRYYLEQILAQPQGEKPSFSLDELDRARRFCIDFVRPGGPLPSLRVGAQPYGFLPVQTLNLPRDATTPIGRFISILQRLRSVWESALPQATRLNPGAQSGDDLVELLRMQPVSVGVRGRLAFDKQFFIPTGVVQRDMDPNLKAHANILRSRVRQLAAEPVVGEGRVYDLLPAEMARLLAAPLVQPGGEVPGAPLSPNYITFLRTASFDDVLKENFPVADPQLTEPDNLLYLLLRQSVLLAYVNVANRILVRRGSLSDQFIREPALVDILGTARPARTRTLLRLLDLDPDLRANLHTLTAAQEPEAAELEELRASLEHLETQPVDVLARQLCASLDLFAYRLDAWITSLATQRLNALRKEKARGIGVGGFGWVEDLEPNPRTLVSAPPAGEADQPLYTAREKGGFIHAPSMAQASAAAVMRSGYLTQPGEANSRPYAVDLSSRRVRLAQWLLDGIRQGQPLGALLGYRFERGLHERKLDRFIDGFRRISLLADVYQAVLRLRQAVTMPPGPERTAEIRAAQQELADAKQALNRRYQFPINAEVGALEKITASRVADGLTLSRLFEAGRLPLMS